MQVQTPTELLSVLRDRLPSCELQGPLCDAIVYACSWHQASVKLDIQSLRYPLALAGSPMLRLSQQS
jgi:hypothetical protein